jgi:hypothetical protein
MEAGAAEPKVHGMTVHACAGHSQLIYLQCFGTMLLWYYLKNKPRHAQH